jgi:hypothetical protein
VRRQWVDWERAAEVRDAARGWRQARAIDEPTEERIRAAFPDPTITSSLTWRVLTACMVTAVILFGFGAVVLAIEPWRSGFPMLLFAGAVACLVVTELLEASPRHARRGGAGATGFWTVALFLAGLLLFLDNVARVRFDDAVETALVAGALAWGAACWRWGSPVFGGLAGVSLLLALQRLPYGRGLWLLGGAALAAFATRCMDRASWAPSHRRAAMVLGVIGVAATYAAVNAYSLDEHLVEGLGRLRTPRGPWPPAQVALSAVGTAVIPVLLLGFGLASRRAIALDAGIVTLTLSLVTLRHYVHVGPLWAALTASGAALVVLASIVERALRRATGGEIRGFTADRLFSDEQRQRAFQIIPVVATLTPGAAPGQKDFAGGGGRFGGGGASEKF